MTRDFAALALRGYIIGLESGLCGVVTRPYGWSSAVDRTMKRHDTTTGEGGDHDPRTTTGR